MPDDPSQPIVLMEVPTEAQAAIIVAALAELGIEAQMAGGLISGMRAEAPGQVGVLVHAEDAERARDAIRAIEDGSNAPEED